MRVDDPLKVVRVGILGKSFRRVPKPSTQRSSALAQVGLDMPSARSPSTPPGENARKGGSFATTWRQGKAAVSGNSAINKAYSLAVAALLNSPCGRRLVVMSVRDQAQPRRPWCASAPIAPTVVLKRTNRAAMSWYSSAPHVAHMETNIQFTTACGKRAVPEVIRSEEHDCMWLQSYFLLELRQNKHGDFPIRVGQRGQRAGHPAPPQRQWRMLLQVIDRRGPEGVRGQQ